MYIILNDAKGRHRHTVPVSSFAHCNSEGLLLLELTGVDTQNRAVWANIVKHRTERNLTPTNATFVMGDTTSIQVIPSNKYHKLERPGRVLLMHNGLTRFQLDYLLGGTYDQPSPWFAAALQAKVPLPVLDHWLLPLWKGAVAMQLVQLVSTVAGPVNVWQFSHDRAEHWLNMATTLIRQKTLTEEPPPLHDTEVQL